MEQAGLGPRLGGTNLENCVILVQIRVETATRRWIFVGSIARASHNSGTDVVAVMVQSASQGLVVRKSLCSSNTGAGAPGRRPWCNSRAGAVTKLSEIACCCWAVFIHRIASLCELASHPSPVLHHIASWLSCVVARAAAATDHVRVLRFWCAGASLQLQIRVVYDSCACGSAIARECLAVCSSVLVPCSV